MHKIQKNPPVIKNIILVKSAQKFTKIPPPLTNFINICKPLIKIMKPKTTTICINILYFFGILNDIKAGINIHKHKTDGINEVSD